MKSFVIKKVRPSSGRTLYHYMLPIESPKTMREVPFLIELVRDRSLFIPGVGTKEKQKTL
jgi:hypothetical protein